jgi:hypothetical protein
MLHRKPLRRVAGADSGAEWPPYSFRLH